VKKSGSDSNFRDSPSSALRADSGNRSLTPIFHLQPEFEAMKARYPAGFESSLTLPCLRRIQEVRGYVADQDIDWLVQYLGVPRIQIEEVLSYYTQFLRAPIGRWHVQTCRNVSCSMRGAERLIDHLSRKLGVKVGETTADGRFTLSVVECLGSCGTAPVVMVNDAYHENMDAAKLDALLEGMK
jgi:NADH-quinone oxidoreductase subunit E